MTILNRDPAAPPTAEALRAHCRAQMATFKVPKTYAFISPEEMPRTATGMILHRILRERHRA